MSHPITGMLTVMIICRWLSLSRKSEGHEQFNNFLFTKQGREIKMGSQNSKLMKEKTMPPSRIPTPEEYAAQAELYKSRVDTEKLIFQFPILDNGKKFRKDKGPTHRICLGVKKCCNGHYFHESIKSCNECGRGPVSEKIDFKAIYKEEDEVFTDGDDGPGLEYFNLIKCENGHIRHQRIKICRQCN